MSVLYDNYLREHINAVQGAYIWMRDNLDMNLFALVNVNLFEHDASKYSTEEYDAYDKYFYGANKSSAVVNNFNRAWLHHIHHNPHHWQHWVLMEDDPKGTPIYIEMPENYVIEMICDWWSFSFRKGDLREIFSWYNSHKNIMRLHKNTRKLVEEILEAIRIRLDELDELKGDGK